MKILVNTDSSIKMSAALAKTVMEEASEILDRYADRITRAEIHLSDVNKGKTGRVDKRVAVEIRVARMQPIAVTAETKEIEASVNLAMRRAVRALNSALGKQKLTRTVAKPLPTVKPMAVKRVQAAAAAKKAAKNAAKEAVIKRQEAKLTPRGPKKLDIYQARRTSWPKA